MFDRWKLQNFAPGEGLALGAHAAQFADDAWLPIAVPGDVHRALLAAGRIPDPFYDRNEDQVAWMEGREWWYRTAFDGPAAPADGGERLQLVFHGLDTFATIWLNGQELGRHRNMFREAVFDVTGALHAGGPNTLALCFDPPLAQVDEAALPLWAPGVQSPPHAAIRKAQYGYGWDWGPRLPTIGIYRPVELRRQRLAALAGLRFATLEIDPATGVALVSVRLEIDRFATGASLDITVSLRAPDGSIAGEQSLALAGDADRAAAYLQVPRARLWWSHGLGEQPLYTLEATLAAGGEMVDRRAEWVGIRTLTLDQSPDPGEAGTRFFRFVLNGVPIFAKGADWIPADSFPGAIEPDRYTMLLTAARDANMNMIRVWGGGLYEHDCFYEECDRLGLLIWQDFMFACASYPEDDHFAAEVRAEAHYQVRRLRNHASLALWCGNNENQWIFDRAFWDVPENRVPGVRYYDEILPAVVAAEDGHTPYWPGSPFGGNDHDSAEEGDRHNWEVWHGNLPRRFGQPSGRLNTPEGVSYTRYAEDLGRFISEFGMHAAPVLATLRTVIPEDQLYHHSPSMDHHNKDNPKNKGDNLMQATTGLPTTLEDYVDLSMIAQAEGLKFGIEHYRRRMPHCSGTLIWQLNDCWPVLSWSVLDYYGIGKAGYYYLKRVYSPVLASFKALPDGGLELWLTSDRLQPIEDTLEVLLQRFDGEILHRHTVETALPANSSRPVARWGADELQGGPDRLVVVRSAGDLFPANRHFFVALKDLRRARPEVAIDLARQEDGSFAVTLRAAAHAHFVHLLVPGQGVSYSDNYIDLLPGEARTLTVARAGAPLTSEQIQVRWR